MLALHYVNGHTVWFNPYTKAWCVKPGLSSHCTNETATFATRDAAHAAVTSA